MTSVPDITHEREWWLYERALTLVSEQVDRQWGTAQFFVILNASTIGGALTLLQVVQGRAVAFLAMLVLTGGAIFAYAGMREVANAKRYYRTLVAKRTLLEQRLGLAGHIPGGERTRVGIYALGALADTTKTAAILADVDAYVEGPIRPRSSIGWARTTLLVMGAFNILAVVVIANALSGCAAMIPCVPVA